MLRLLKFNKRCNCCGQEIVGHKDCLEVTKNWGYNSNKDLEQHKFNLCESCYDRMVDQFKIPVEINDIDVMGHVI